MDQRNQPHPAPLRSVVPAQVNAHDKQVVEDEDRSVDEAGKDSFPASDPPGWTPAVAGPVKRPRTSPSSD